MHAHRGDLEARERREQNLRLVRVLREPADIGAAVDHALLDLEDDALAAARRVLHRDTAVLRRAHESALNAAAHAIFVGLPEGIRQRHT